MRFVELMDEFGSATPTLQVWREPSRLEPVVFRTVKGLHYDMFKTPLSVDCPMEMIDSGGVSDKSSESMEKLVVMLGDLFDEFETVAPVTIHPEVFSYKRLVADDHESAAVWLLTFLQRHWFLVYVNVQEGDSEQ
jgi:hypothetical protein